MPLMNEDIAEIKKLLTEIRDRLAPVPTPVSGIVVETPKNKGGRPKGSKNAKRTGKR